MINIEGFEIPNRAEELTIKQFDKMNQITTNLELQDFEKWLEKFIYLGVDAEVFDTMDVPTFRKYVEEYNSVDDIPTKKINSFDIEGFTYTAPEEISIKDMSLIEKAWKKSKDDFGVSCIAILFKREDLSKTEHYSEAHIKHKKKLFESVKVDVAFPYITEVLQLLVKQVEEEQNGVTE